MDEAPGARVLREHVAKARAVAQPSQLGAQHGAV
jgi:hypothetical protein